MNSLICLLSAFHVLALLQTRLFISKVTKRLIYLGILLPLGDYILRFILGEIWFYSGDLIFHSFFYQGLFWLILAVLYWIYNHRIGPSIRILSPLLGLSFYFLFSLFTTESLNFFAPLFDIRIHWGWIYSGYLIPTVFALLLWLNKVFSKMTVLTISRFSLIMLVAFVAFAGIIRNNASNAVAQFKNDNAVVSLLPANSLLTEWHAIIYQNKNYQIRRYHFVQGWQGALEEQEAFRAFDDSQYALLHPSIRNLYRFGFRNPTIRVYFENETVLVTITELKPLIDFLWIKKVEIKQNHSGQIVDLEIFYGTVI